MYTIGQRVTIRKREGRFITNLHGTIVYVHPQTRFVTVDLGKYRECFSPEEITLERR